MDMWPVSLVELAFRCVQKKVKSPCWFIATITSLIRVQRPSLWPYEPLSPPIAPLWTLCNNEHYSYTTLDSITKELSFAVVHASCPSTLVYHTLGQATSGSCGPVPLFFYVKTPSPTFMQSASFADACPFPGVKAFTSGLNGGKYPRFRFFTNTSNFRFFELTNLVSEISWGYTQGDSNAYQYHESW